MAPWHDDSGIAVSGELQALDNELRGILIEERCSFGPELRSELAGEYKRLQGGGRRNRAWPRSWRMAALAVVVVFGCMLSSPRLRNYLNSSPGPEGVPELHEPVSPVVVAGEVLRSAQLARGALVDIAPDSEASVALVWAESFETMPVLQDPRVARQIVADEIPPRLYEEEDGGTVHLLIWVSPDGAVELPQIDKSSGFASLDLAALRAIRSFRFAPATRLGVPVGAWFRFPVGFRPRSTQVLLDAEAQSVSLQRSN